VAETTSARSEMEKATLAETTPSSSFEKQEFMPADYADDAE
jgi:hypothetical protein